MEEEADVRWPVPSPRRPRTWEAGSEGNGTARRGAGTWRGGPALERTATRRARRPGAGADAGTAGAAALSARTPARAGAGARSGAGAAQSLWPTDGGVDWGMGTDRRRG